MKTNLILLFALISTLTTFAQAPANDECANAIVITDDITTATTINFNNAMATESLQTSCGNASFTYLDMWYQFNVPANGNLMFSGMEYYHGFTLYNNCGAIPTEIDCFFDDTLVTGLTTGTYTLRVSSPSAVAGANSFTLQLLDTPVNDECVNATIITDDITTATTINFNNTAATQSWQSSCDNPAETYLDLWYEFNMPTNGNLEFTGVDTLNGFSLYSSCGTIATEIDCFSSNTLITSLTTGAYTLRVSSVDINSGDFSFTLQAIAALVNDDCANATVITDDITTATTISFNNANATQSLYSSCENVANTYLDLWYQFNMPIDGNLRFSNINTADGFTLYNSCGIIPTEIACFFDDNTISLIAGTYTLRVSSTSNQAGADSFTFQAFVPPVNDECANATVITDDITTATTINYNNEEASQSLKSSCEYSSTYSDIWYQFNMPSNGNLSIVLDNNYKSGFTLYDNCGTVPTEIYCHGSNYPSYSYSGSLYGLSMGTYALRVSSSIDYAGPGSFTIQAFAPPINDECVNAVVLTQDLTSTAQVSYNNRGASQSLQSSCENSSKTYLDIWYQFDMPVHGDLEFTHINSYVDETITLYDSCGTVPTELYCFNTNTVLYGLSAGTYTLRVSSLAVNATAGNFRLKAIPAPVLVNDECANAIVIPDDITTITTINYSNGSSTQSLESSCDYYEYSQLTFSDIWYQFDMPVNGNVRFGSSGGHKRFTIYSNCGAIPMEIGCVRSGYTFYGLPIGTYTLRFAEAQSQIGPYPDYFTIEAIEAPVNNECTNAMVIPDISTPQLINFSNIGASQSTQNSCEYPDFYHSDVWYQFDMPANSVLTIDEFTGIHPETTYTLYNNCGDLTELNCFDVAGFGGPAHSQALPMGTYILRLAHYIQFSSLSFEIKATPAPSNDECTNPIVINDITTHNLISFNNTATTQSLQSSCENGTGTYQDAWYQFSLTENSELFFELYNSSNFGVSLYDSCGGTEIDCFVGYNSPVCCEDYRTFNNVPIGTYLMRVSTTDTPIDSFYVQAFEAMLSVEEFNNTLGVSIYPTLSNGIVNIKAASSLGETKVSVFDINGRTVYTSKVNLSTNVEQLNLENKSKGLYFLKLENNGNTMVEKIVLK